jgi:F-type H+-transporting ATPase subunit b
VFSIGPTFVWVAVNLLILYLFLRRILFKPVTAMLENRKKTISDAFANADKAKAEAAELKSKYEEQIKHAKEEGEKIVEAAKAKASKEYDEVVAASKRDSEAMLVKAQAEIEREKANMLKDVRSQIAGLALLAASKVIEENMDTERNKALVNKFIDEAGAA